MKLRSFGALCAVFLCTALFFFFIRPVYAAKPTEPPKPKPKEMTFEEMNYQAASCTSQLFSDFVEDNDENGLRLTPGTICSGVSFYGCSLAGQTPGIAKKLVSDVSEAILRKTIHFESTNHDHIYEISARDLGIECRTDNIRKALDDATIPEGSVFERYKFVKDHMMNSEDYRLSFSGRPRAKIASVLSERLSDWDSDCVNATVSFVNGVKSVTPSSDGQHYGFDKAVGRLLDDMESDRILLSGETYYLHPDEFIEPASFTTEDAETCTVIGSYTTEYTRPYDTISSNREMNLIVSASNMNGTVIAPGETASALTMYRDVTYENGYRAAATIMGNVHVDAIGGGICQTTTTLYNAVLYAELGIDYRDNHSMVVTYVPASRDAMVYYEGWDHQSSKYDFRFTNTSSDDIMIESFVDTANCTLTVNILGHEDHAPGRSVEFVSEILGMTPPAISCITDPGITNSYTFGAVNYRLASGSGPTSGMTSRLWKVVYQDGVEIERSLINSNDVYKPQNATYACAPGVSVFASCNSDRATGYVTINMVH